MGGGVKSDRWIREQCTPQSYVTEGGVYRTKDFKPMIEPFEPGQVSEVEGFDDDKHTAGGDPRAKRKVISYGCSGYGYDCRITDEFKIFTNVWGSVVDPKAFDPKAFVEHKGDYCIIPPNSFALARTVEWFNIPRNVIVIGIGKSTYARCGIILNVTPFEPEWRGYATLEISNTTPLPAKIYANEGICQLVFFDGDEVCEVSYADKKGKYQDQKGIVGPKV